MRFGHSVAIKLIRIIQVVPNWFVKMPFLDFGDGNLVLALWAMVLSIIRNPEVQRMCDFLREIACANEPSQLVHIGCSTSGVAQRAMREAAPHARGVSKARQLEEGWLQSKLNKLFRAFSLSPFSGEMT
jgi:hypothetical protein